jgi:acyl carrier protein
MSDVAAVVKRFVEAKLPHTNIKIADDYPLLDSGLIDSVGLFELVSHLEQECGVKIEDEELVPENFRTINDIVAFLNGKRRT